MVRFLFVLILIAIGPRAGAAVQVLIRVDLPNQRLRVEKQSLHQRKHLEVPILPAVQDSFRSGTFRPGKLYQRFRSVNGNTYLENVIFFDGARTIRTSRLYSRLERENARTTGSVLLEPDVGGIIFDTVRRYGAANTRIEIRK